MRCRTPAPRLQQQQQGIQQQSSGQVTAPPTAAPQVAAAAPQFGAPHVVEAAPQVATAAPQVAATAPQVAAAAPQFVALHFDAAAPQTVGPEQQGTGQGHPGLSAAAHQTPVKWLQRLKCNQCNYITNIQNELVYHIKTKHQNQNIKCDNCPQVFMTSEALVNHIVREHTNCQERQRNTLASGVWTCTFCGVNFNGKEERDNHLCSRHTFQTIDQQESRRKKSQEPCKRGDQCHHLKYGKCWYFHAQNVERNIQVPMNNSNTGRQNMTITSQGQSSHNNSRPILFCKFQDGCLRKARCWFKHIDQGFLIQENQRNNQ